MSRMTMVYGDLYLSEDKLHPKVKEMRDRMIAGEDRNKIANEYKVSLDYVFRIYKRFNIGQILNAKKQQQPQQQEEKKEVEKTLSAVKIETPEGEKEQPVYKKGRKITEEGILYIIESYEAGKSPKEIAKDVGCSEASVYNYAKEYGLTGQKKKSSKPKGTPFINIQPSKASEEAKAKREAQEREDRKCDVVVSTQEQKPMVDLKSKPYPTLDSMPHIDPGMKEINLGRKQLKCGLIDGRHDGIPAKIWVFRDNPNFNYFDYDLMEKVVNQFIDQYISFEKDENDVEQCTTDMICYMTGLPCASATVIKVTNLRHVNLTLRHYMSRSDKYTDQVIWDQFGSMGLNRAFPNVDRLYMKDCDESSVVENFTYYSVKTIDFTKDSKYCVEYIYPELNADVWQKFAEVSAKIYSADCVNRRSAYIYMQKIRDGKEVNLKLISKMSNHNFEG